MTDRPILFSAPMIRALLNSRKTQTRRIIKPQPILCSNGRWDYCQDFDDMHFQVLTANVPNILSGNLRISAGDRLWVRESWRTKAHSNGLSPSQLNGPEITFYDADTDWSLNKTVGRRRASMHMPRDRSRITLLVTDVRIQRLQDISEDDAQEEGCFKGKATGRVSNSMAEMRLGGDYWINARDWFADLWDAINGQGSWDANPWVAAYTFQVVKANIDTLQDAA